MPEVEQRKLQLWGLAHTHPLICIMTVMARTISKDLQLVVLCRDRAPQGTRSYLMWERQVELYFV